MNGNYLKMERISKGLTQKQVAEAIGVSQQAISFIENNVNLPNIDIIVKIADLYGVTVDELIGRDTTKIKLDQRYNNGTINNNF